MSKDKNEPKQLRKTAQERRRYPIGVDPRKERRRERAEARKAAQCCDRRGLHGHDSGMLP